MSTLCSLAFDLVPHSASLSGLLGALQALSAAVMGSSEEEDDEEGQAFTVTQTPSCADTHKE